ncbi:unnamed protein product [Linum tenue]|uniref:Uncharacterized protein n=1 Tax=Linum tenue TaxID=586396 RepID=A0AAV0NZZ4_9ROSI|nr:unnamed protein product [Linum tenue]
MVSHIQFGRWRSRNDQAVDLRGREGGFKECPGAQMGFCKMK